MISRRKFLQGALGFTSAAILPAGVIMPIQPIKGFTAVDLYRHYMKEWQWDTPKIMMVEPFNFYPNPEDKWGTGIAEMAKEQQDQENQLYRAITDARNAMDRANVPQNDRVVWFPNDTLYRKFLEKNHVT